MVNVGGPSKGCFTCIKRKIRCDRQRPSCSQCLKSRRECLGYRNEADLVFRDQSQAVAVVQAREQQDYSKNRANTQAKRRPKPSSQRMPVALQTPATKAQSRESTDEHVIPRSPTLEMNSSLITFFARNYTCNRYSQGTNMFWVPDNFADLLKHDITRLSVISAGAMALARLQKSPVIFREAQRNYSDALLSFAALGQQHAQIDQDAVLLTIQFLAIFEVFAAFENSRRSWVTHLSGLGTLLKQSPAKVMNTELGFRMLVQGRSQAIVNALQTKTQVPEAFRHPNQRVPNTMPSHVYVSDLADRLLLRLVTLQAENHSLGPSAKLLEELIALDDDLYQWTQNVTHHWFYLRHLSKCPSDLWWDTRCDIYPTPIVAHVWNKVRAARIVTCDLIEEALVYLCLLSSSEIDHYNFNTPPATSEDRAAIVQHLVEDICASLPLYWRPPGSPPRNVEAECPPSLGTATFALWPLEVLGTMRNAGPGLVDWVIQTFERIHLVTGTMNAQRVATKIRMKQGNYG